MPVAETAWAPTSMPATQIHLVQLVQGKSRFGSQMLKLSDLLKQVHRYFCEGIDLGQGCPVLLLEVHFPA